MVANPTKRIERLSPRLDFLFPLRVMPLTLSFSPATRLLRLTILLVTWWLQSARCRAIFRCSLLTCFLALSQRQEAFTFFFRLGARLRLNALLFALTLRSPSRRTPFLYPPAILPHPALLRVGTAVRMFKPLSFHLRGLVRIAIAIGISAEASWISTARLPRFEYCQVRWVRYSNSHDENNSRSRTSKGLQPLFFC